jgi:hypothetical protein
MADWGEGFLIGHVEPYVLFYEGIRGWEYNTQGGSIQFGNISTGSVHPDPSDVKNGVAYTDPYRAPLVGTFTGGIYNFKLPLEVVEIPSTLNVVDITGIREVIEI